MDNHTDIMQRFVPAMDAVEQLEKEFHPEVRAMEHSRLSDAVRCSKEGDTSGVDEALERKFTPKKVTNKDFQVKLDADFTRHCIKCPSANKEVFRTDEIERFAELITATETVVGKEHSRTMHCIETAKAYIQYLYSKEESSDKAIYEIDSSLLRKVFGISEGVVFDCTYVEFQRAVIEGDLSRIKSKSGSGSKRKHLVYMLSLSMGGEWYKAVCESMSGIEKNWTPSDCSGQTQEDRWGKALRKIIPKPIKSKD